MPGKTENIKAIKVECVNGSLITFQVGEESEIFVFQSDDFGGEGADAEKWACFLNSVTERFFNCHHKHETRDSNILIYPGPGRKADYVHHVRAFLNDIAYKPPQSLIDEVTAVIEKWDEESV